MGAQCYRATLVNLRTEHEAVMDRDEVVADWAAPLEWHPPSAVPEFVDVKKPETQEPITPLDTHRPCQEPERCALCLQALSAFALAACIDGQGRRVCSHYFHYACLRRVQPRRCPVCRETFDNPRVLPSLKDKPDAWGQLIAVSGGCQPNKKDVLAAFQAMLPMSPAEVESLLASTPEWGEPAHTFGVEHLRRLYDAMQQHIPSPPPMFPADETYDEPHVVATGSQHDHNNAAPGEVCSCGRIHAFRGDRVRRSIMWRGNPDELALGELGTIVRDEEGCDAVFVQWDLAAPGDVRCYSWPISPSMHEVDHVPFTEISSAVSNVQARTGLSSAASTAYMRLSATRADVQSVESELRAQPKLFHRCRVLPEQSFVQGLFDACPPCQCSRPDCRGGVRWNQQAARHLGREGYVLKTDERDNTILVEMAGRCNCKIWFPAQALEAVYDPDTAVQPRFQSGTQVECKIDGEWHTGTVSRVWWRPSSGWGNRPTVPYSVKLEDGRSVFAPRDSDRLIKRKVRQELM